MITGSSPVASGVDQPCPKPNGLAPPRRTSTPVVILFAVLFTPVFAYAMWRVYDVYLDSKKVAMAATIVETRVVYEPIRSPKNAGPWCREYEVEFPVGDDHRRQWFRAGRYGSKIDALWANAGEVGRTKTIWLDPDRDEPAQNTAPLNPLGQLYLAAVIAVPGSLGMLALGMLLRRLIAVVMGCCRR